MNITELNITVPEESYNPPAGFMPGYRDGFITGFEEAVNSVQGVVIFLFASTLIYIILEAILKRKTFEVKYHKWTIDNKTVMDWLLSIYLTIVLFTCGFFMYFLI